MGSLRPNLHYSPKMEDEGATRKKSESESESAAPATDPRDLVSSDDEIDYSVKPEFYDPNLDDKDELWVQKQRKGRISDAILSCPACFTTLCLDCQRHEKYVTQYRAMFVFNCKVVIDQILRETKRNPRKPKGQPSHCKVDNEKDEVFRPVRCMVCSTEVGVYDEDEVYHFFNVIPSEP